MTYFLVFLAAQPILALVWWRFMNVTNPRGEMKYPIRIKPTWIQKIICYFRHDITHDTMSTEAYAELCVHADNHSRAIAERMLRLEKALAKCKEQRNAIFLKARYYPDQCGDTMVSMSVYADRCDSQIDAILEGK